MNKKKIEEGTRLILEGIGEDLNREGLVGTPKRIARLYSKLLIGYDAPPKIITKEEEKDKYPNHITLFKNKKEYDQIILRKVEKCYSFCEHHLVPFFGKVYVAYVPGEFVIGMNKIDTIVRYFAGKLQLQEDLTMDIANFLDETLKPKGVMVVLQGFRHLCGELQGDQGNFTSSEIKGLFREDDGAKNEVLKLIELSEKGSEK